MPNRDLIVIGASAGGIEALQQIAAALPPQLNAAVVIVMHTSPNSGGLLPRLLTRAGRMPAIHPKNGEPIENGMIYVAPPDHHLIVEPGMLRTIRGPRENHHRPAIDPTFRSAAASYGRRVIGVVLTGLLDDGTSGLMVVRAHGGAAVVQDPRTALFPSMPESALERVPDSHVVPLAELPVLLARLVADQIEVEPRKVKADAADNSEIRLAELDMSEVENEIRNGNPSPYGCPECGGVLWEIDQAGLLRFRCRVGHAYTARHLRAEQRHAIEAALWAALRALEESASLYRRMALRARNSNQDKSMMVYEERAENAEGNSRTLRDFLVHVNGGETPSEEIEEIESKEKVTDGDAA
ncbi:MAG: chemotaxis protein CheB [Acidobacteriaceae bacterium]